MRKPFSRFRHLSNEDWAIRVSHRLIWERRTRLIANQLPRDFER